MSKILVVEDDEAIADLIKIALKTRAVMNVNG